MIRVIYTDKSGTLFVSSITNVNMLLQVFPDFYDTIFNWYDTARIGDYLKLGNTVVVVKCKL